MQIDFDGHLKRKSLACQVAPQTNSIYISICKTKSHFDHIPKSFEALIKFILCFMPLVTYCCLNNDSIYKTKF